MAYASETGAGKAWAENRIRQLTGGDVMTANFMHGDHFEFQPQSKLVIVGNNKPAFSNVDGAIRRRFNVLPFDKKPAVPDLELKAALEAEFPGILSWAIQGCLDWQGHGLPALLSDATTGPLVREAQRHLATWALQPIAMMMAEEMTAKPGGPVEIDVMRPAQAFDVSGRARALATIVEAMAEAKEGGLSPAEFDTAAKLVNWGNGDGAF